MNIKVIGNKLIQVQIGVAATSAIQRNSAIFHTLLAGASGCGKTTTANYMANLLKTPFIQVSAEGIKNYKDVKNIVGQLPLDGYNENGEKVGRVRPGIVFLDEVHNLPLKGQELLGILMENYIMPLPPDRKGLKKQWIPEFTLVGATTNDGKLSKPFRDRFPLKFVFTPYEFGECVEIVKHHAGLLEIKIDDPAVEEIAMRGRGTPRILVNTLKRVRDFAIATDKPHIDKECADLAFMYMKINEDGLGEADIAVMIALFKIGKPVGIENLAIITNESEQAIAKSIEPFLIQKAYIVRGPRGRLLTDAGVEYLAERGHIDKMDAMRELMERM